jgi:hypothetical protein
LFDIMSLFQIRLVLDKLLEKPAKSSVFLLNLRRLFQN